MEYNPTINRIYLLIEDDDLPYQHPDYIHCINVSKQPWIRLDTQNANYEWTYMILLRVVLDKILWWEEQVVQLDLDSIVRGNIDALFEPLSEQEWCKGCIYDITTIDTRDTPLLVGPKHIHAPVMVLNLNAWRNNKISDQCIELINSRTLTFPEEDAISTIAKEHMVCIPKTIHNIDIPTDEQVIYHIGSSTWDNTKYKSRYDTPLFQSYINKPWPIQIIKE